MSLSLCKWPAKSGETMRKLKVRREEREQRLNKYLLRKMPEAPSSFIYKMLRKKNITLNGKKASGSELLQEGDLVTLFLSDETILKFGGTAADENAPEEASAKRQDEEREMREFLSAFRAIGGRIGKSGILYEDGNILAVRKPVGVLSQKSLPSDMSMNEWLVGYLLDEGKVSAASIRQFRPSVCNRLDRNTGGILLCAVSLQGARKMAQLLRDRSLRKFYQAVVVGRMESAGRIEGYLEKDHAANAVSFTGEKSPDRESARKEGVYTKTLYRPLLTGEKFSLMEMELITGKTHQIRSHLAAAGHPIAGDPKYGDTGLGRQIREEYGIRGQMLWCSRIEFPRMEEEFEALSQRVITCDPPALYHEMIK